MVWKGLREEDKFNLISCISLKFKQWFKTPARVGYGTLTDSPNKTACTGQVSKGKLRNQQRVEKTTDVITHEWAMEKRKRMLDGDVLRRFLPIIILSSLDI